LKVRRSSPIDTKKPVPTEQARAALAKKMKFKLADEFPELAAKLTQLLNEEGEEELAGTVSGLTVVERCRCGDEFCATMYTVRPPRETWGRSHRNVSLDPKAGYLILDVLDQEIVGIEVLFRNEIREHLLKVLP
jgi:uncharacterized protein (DUF2147 family)